MDAELGRSQQCANSSSQQLKSYPQGTAMMQKINNAKILCKASVKQGKAATNKKTTIIHIRSNLKFKHESHFLMVNEKFNTVH